MKLFFLLVFIFLIFQNNVKADGPWNNQYCNVKSEIVKTVDQNGKTIEKSEEKVICDDGVKDFLHDSGIAKDCRIFTWFMPINGKPVEQRGIACERLDGSGFEIVSGYHSDK